MPTERRAHVAPEEGEAPYEQWLGAWIAACLALAKPDGAFIIIHRPDSLGAILGALAGRAGAATILPVHACAAGPAIRVLVRAIKGSRAPLSIAPGLTLHEGAGFTPKAEAIHRGEALIAW